jgi:hypothetical protein
VRQKLTPGPAGWFNGGQILTKLMEKQESLLGK